MLSPDLQAPEPFIQHLQRLDKNGQVLHQKRPHHVRELSDRHRVGVHDTIASDVRHAEWTRHYLPPARSSEILSCSFSTSRSASLAVS